MRNIPNNIYLQVGEHCPDNADFDELNEVTWSKDKINLNDIEFINKQNLDGNSSSLQKLTKKGLADYISMTTRGLRKMRVNHPKKFDLIWRGWVDFNKEKEK